MGPTANYIGSTHYKLRTRLYGDCNFYFLVALNFGRILSVSPPIMAQQLRHACHVWIGQLLAHVMSNP
jgi:hypothetical protein